MQIQYYSDHILEHYLRETKICSHKNLYANFSSLDLISSNWETVGVLQLSNQAMEQTYQGSERPLIQSTNLISADLCWIDSDE